MKTKFLLTIGLLGFQLWSISQISLPNAGFEIWDGRDPESWKTSNLPNGITNNVYPVSPGYQGDYAIKGEVIPFPNTPGFPLIPTLESNTSEDGFLINELFPALNLYYKFHPAYEGDVLKILVSVQGEQDVFLGSGFVEISEEAEEFTQLSIPMNYYLELQPTRVFVAMSIDHNGSESLPALGSYFIVDEITMGDVVSSVDKPRFPEIKMGNVYPNPTSSELHIPFTSSKNQGISVDIFDLSGRKVVERTAETLSQGDHTLSVNLDQLPEGMYICRLSTFRGSMTQKVLLSRK